MKNLDQIDITVKDAENSKALLSSYERTKIKPRVSAVFPLGKKV